MIVPSIRVSRLGLALLPWAFASSMLPACSSDSQSPEARIRSLIGRAQEAAEQKRMRTLREMVSDRYADSRGNDRRAVEGLVRYYFLRNRAIHLYTQVKSVKVPERGRAEAVVLVAMAAQPIPAVDAFVRLRAELYRFDVALVADDGREWKVVRAEWRPAELADFL